MRARRRSRGDFRLVGLRRRFGGLFGWRRDRRMGCVVVMVVLKGTMGSVMMSVSRKTSRRSVRKNVLGTTLPPRNRLGTDPPHPNERLRWLVINTR